MNVRTAPIRETAFSLCLPEKKLFLAANDLVANASVRVLNITEGKNDERRVFWSHPTTPNGKIISYNIRYWRSDRPEVRSAPFQQTCRENANLQSPLRVCVNKTAFDAAGGIVLVGLQGKYY